MPLVIYKYILLRRNMKIQTYEGFKILAVGTQADIPVIWMKHDTSLPSTICEITLVDTGMEISPEWDYIGTVQLKEKTIVHHIFQIP